MDEIDSICHLFETQVKHLIHVARAHVEPLGPKDVHGFLTSMDMICRHHVKHEKEGFWPFVQEFTHSEGVRYISGLDNATTGIGKGRAWLLLALQESTLEFYFTSFLAHAAVRARHYRSDALLRQDVRLKRLVVALAELSAAAARTALRVDEYDLDRHVCPPPAAPTTDARLPSTMDVFTTPGAGPEEPLQWSHTGHRSHRPHRSARAHSTSSRQSSRSSGTYKASPEDTAIVAVVASVTGPQERPATCGAPEGHASQVSSAGVGASQPVASRVDTSRTPRDTMLRERIPSTSTPSPEPPDGQKSLHHWGEEAREAASSSASAYKTSDPAVPSKGDVPLLRCDDVKTAKEADGPASVAVVDKHEIGHTVEGCEPSDERRAEAGAAGAGPATAAVPQSPQTASSPGHAGNSAAYPLSSARGSSQGAPDSDASRPISCGASRISDVGCDEDPSVDYTCRKDVQCPGIGDTSDQDHVVGDVSCDGVGLPQVSPKQTCGKPPQDIISDETSQVLPVRPVESPEKAETVSDQTTLAAIPAHHAAQSSGGVPPSPLREPSAPLQRPELTSSSERRPSAARPEGVPSAPCRRPSAASGASSRVHVTSTESAVRRRPLRLPGAHSEVALRPRAAAACPPEKRVTWAGTDRETEAVAALLPSPPERGERGAPEGQEDPPLLASRAPSTLSICSSSCTSAGSGGAGNKSKRCSRLYEPSALGSPLPPSAVKEMDRHIEDELTEGRRRKASAAQHSAQVVIGHSLATRLVVSLFKDDEMALPTGFKVLWGDHHSLRTCLLVFTTYRVVVLRRSTLMRLRDSGDAPQHADQPPQQPDAAYDYTSIASVKLAFHEQALALQRPDGNYSRWLWLGDRAETRRLLSHLQAAVGRSPLRPLPPQVYTSQPHLQLYRAEIAYREKRPEILYTSLVYFEDFEVPGETPKLSAQLMYKTEAREGWSVGHFVLWDTDLLLYPGGAAASGGGAPLDRWSLPAVTACRRLTELSRPHQLRLEAAERALTLAAPDADTCATWAATVRDIMELTVPSQLPRPQPRCVVLTRRGLYIVEEMAFSPRLMPGYDLYPYGYLVKAAGTLRALSSANADSHGAVHLEFDSADAAETTGSWRLYFLTLAEQRDFLQHLLTAFQSRTRRPLSVGQISHHMREVCLSGVRYVRTRWNGIADC